jgi:hypothetical protein
MEAKARIDQIVDTLQKDLKDARGSRTWTLVGGALIALIVFVVFMSMTMALKSNVRPDTLATVAAHATREMVKEARPVAEEAFKKNLPLFLKNLRLSLVHDLIPQLRKEIEKSLRTVIADAFARSSKDFLPTLEASLKMATGEVKEGKLAPDALAAIIVAQFDKERERRYAEAPEETLGQQFAQSRHMLEGLNRKLLLLTGKKTPKTRQETLELKFLRAWVSLVSKGDVDGVEVPEVGK